MLHKTLFSIAFAMLGGVLFGDICTWTGNGNDGKWSTPENWANKNVPVSRRGDTGDKVVISVPPSANPVIIDNDMGTLVASHLVIAEGSGALKLTGGRLQLTTFDKTTGSALPSLDNCAFQCAAVGVSVEIANEIYFTGSRTFIQAAGSDVTFSGGIAGNGNGYVCKRVVDNSMNARCVFAGPSTFMSANADAFYFRGGTNVLAHAQALGPAGTIANAYFPGSAFVFAGGEYGTRFLVGGTSVAMVFQGDTTLASLCHGSGQSGGEFTFVFENNPTVRFTGDVNLSSGNAKAVFRGAGPAAFRVEGGFGVKSFDANERNEASTYDFWFGENLGNGFTSLYMAFFNIHALHADVLNPAYLFYWGFAATNERGVFDLNGYDQTIDRFTSSQGGSDSGVGRLISTPAGKPASLVLKASQSDYSRNRLSGPLTLVYEANEASFVQSLCTNDYEATGDIVVRKGTIKMVGPATYRNAAAIRIGQYGVFEDASTASGSLANVGEVVVDAGGVFRVATGTTNPFTGGKTAIRIETGSFLEGNSSLENVYLDGGYVDGGRYQSLDGADPAATKVAWIRGGGVLSINTGCTEWKNAADGVWGASENWSYGVPDATKSARISKSGVSYGVSVIADAGTLTNLTVANAGIQTTTLSVSAPMAFRDATVDLGAGARFDVGAGGAVRYESSAAGVADVRFRIGTGAELNVADGRFLIAPPSSHTDRETLDQAGGSIRVSGNGVFELGKMNARVFGTGLTRFEDNALLTIDRDNGPSTFYSGPRAENETGRVEFADHAKFWTDAFSTLSLYQIGSDFPGIAVFDYASDEHSRFGGKLAIGTDYGRGEVRIHSGYVSVWYKGIDVGGYTSGRSHQRLDAKGEGLLAIDGGAVYVQTLDVKMPAESGRVEGIVVGAGWNTVPGSESHYHGRIELDGGAITNSVLGNVVVLGAGQATGEIVQNGGEFYNGSTNWPTVIGFEGGSGLYALTNGVATFRADVYVGGAPTNVLERNLSGVCAHRHDAKGKLTLAGGEMNLERDMIVAADGDGMIEVEPAGRMTARSLVLSNGTESASASAVRFRIGEDGSCGKVALSGRLVVAEGTKAEVDLGSYEGPKRSFRLLSCSGMEGTIENVTIKGTSSLVGEARLVQRADGLRLLINSGMALIIR